ncbi:OsmC family protein [Nitrospira sp. Ecomares 2.1]
MADAQVINGVDVAAVNELVKNVESDPKLGECRFHIENTWSTCGQNQSKVSSFYAAKQEIPHDDPFTLNADEPAILAGHDTGANPVEHLLHALASCLTTTLVYHTAVRGIKIEALESELEGDLDSRGFLGLSNKVRSGFENIRVNCKIKTDAENIEKLKTLSTLSPLFDMTSHGTNVQVDIERK